VKRWVKVTLAVIAGLIALLVLNAIAVSNETKDAERNVEGAELIDTSSGTIQVLDEGDSVESPIVLIHCFAGSMRWWDELAPLLSEGHRVIRVDLLGFGGSDKPSTGYAIEDQARAVAEALAELEVTDATIVGHSLGASVAAAVAEQSPDLAARIVNIDQAADESYEDLPFGAGLASTPVIGQALNRLADVAPNSVVRDQYGIAFAPGFNIASGFEDPDQVVEDFDEMTYTSFKDAMDADDEYTAGRPLDDRLSALQIPILVMFGSEDQSYDAESAIERYEDIEGVQAELIDGAGHSPNVETPEVVAPLILAFAEQPTPEQLEAAAARKAAAEKRKAAAKRAAQKAKAPKTPAKPRKSQP
jgi:pimeloyl-ACP methyl ester carboxylesterase